MGFSFTSSFFFGAIVCACGWRSTYQLAVAGSSSFDAQERITQQQCVAISSTKGLTVVWLRWNNPTLSHGHVHFRS
jgi:hypothetical protein